MVINIIMNGYYNTIVREKSEFKYWLDENMKDLGGDIKYKNKAVVNREYVSYFCNKIIQQNSRRRWNRTILHQLQHQFWY